jgi:hypothetical protein
LFLSLSLFLLISFSSLALSLSPLSLSLSLSLSFSQCSLLFSFLPTHAPAKPGSSAAVTSLPLWSFSPHLQVRTHTPLDDVIVTHQRFLDLPSTDPVYVVRAYRDFKVQLSKVQREVSEIQTRKKRKESAHLSLSLLVCRLVPKHCASCSTHWLDDVTHASEKASLPSPECRLLHRRVYERVQ